MNLLKKLRFNIWYFRNPPWETNQTPPELMTFAHSHLPGRALDIGCGTGTNAVYLARQGWQVTGIDFASRAIQIARKKAAAAGMEIDFHVDDIAKPRYIKGKFDVILDIGCYHNLTTIQRKNYRDTLFNGLSDRGTFLLYSFCQTDDSGMGVTQTDLDAFSTHLHKIEHQYGADPTTRKSAWFSYERRKT